MVITLKVPQWIAEFVATAISRTRSLGYYSKVRRGTALEWKGYDYELSTDLDAVKAITGELHKMEVFPSIYESWTRAISDSYLQ